MTTTTHNKLAYADAVTSRLTAIHSSNRQQNVAHCPIDFARDGKVFKKNDGLNDFQFWSSYRKLDRHLDAFHELTLDEALDDVTDSNPDISEKAKKLLESADSAQWEAVRKKRFASTLRRLFAEGWKGWDLTSKHWPLEAATREMLRFGRKNSAARDGMIQDIVTAFKDATDPRGQVSLIWVLSWTNQILGPSVPDALLPLIQEGRHPRLRLEAIRALGRMEEYPNAARIRAALAHQARHASDSEVARAALDAAATFPDVAPPDWGSTTLTTLGN